MGSSYIDMEKTAGIFWILSLYLRKAHKKFAFFGYRMEGERFMKKPAGSTLLILLVCLTVIGSFGCFPKAAGAEERNQGAYSDFDIHEFWYSSLAEKAALSQKWVPIAQRLEAEDPSFSTHFPFLYAFTRCRYGLPAGDDVPLDEALKTAKEAAIALGADEASYDARAVEVLFDVTDADHPIWKIIIYEPKVEFRSQEGAMRRFRVEIHGKTGEIEDAYVINRDMAVLDWRL